MGQNCVRKMSKMCLGLCYADGMLRFIVLFLCLSLAQAHAACRHALTLALDISGSVNHSEYRLQLDGIADALSSPEVQEIIFYNPEHPIALSVFEWSGNADQRVIVDWIDINTNEDLDFVISHLRNYWGERTSLHTAIGSAVAFGKEMLDQRPDCWRHTIDVSGDGKNNLGQMPHQHFGKGGFEAITVNGLAVSVEDDKYDAESVKFHHEDMTSYFEQHVIQGTASFVELARGYSDFKRAMSTKLIRELSPGLFAELPRPFVVRF